MSFFKSLAFSVITRRDLTLTLWPFSEPIKPDKVGDLEHIEVVAANKDLNPCLKWKSRKEAKIQ